LKNGVIASAVACALAAGAQGPSRIDADRLFDDVRTLSQPAFEGRLTGTPGNHKAQAFILARFRALGLEPIVPGPSGPAYEQPFGFGERFPDAKNLMGVVTGSSEPTRFTALTAHFDHLGVRGGSIYPGADDDASGVAAMLAAAEYFSHHRPRRSILFIAFDGEEEGLRGSTFFIAHPPVPLKAIALDVNLDMVSRGDRNELVVAGTYFSPELKDPLAAAASQRHLTLVFGHDRPASVQGNGPGGNADKDNWTNASDHGPFHQAGIPFLYFGVEDHPDYHRPTDTADKIPRVFFVEAANLILDALLTFDAR
jgi:Zn-dependent M28 family amino/carboxypeptidase